MNEIKITVFRKEIDALSKVLDLVRPDPRRAGMNDTVEAWLIANELLDRLEGAVRSAVDDSIAAPVAAVVDRPTKRIRRITPDLPMVKCDCVDVHFDGHRPSCPSA